MTMAAAWLAKAAKKRPRAIDLWASALVHEGKAQEGIIAAARYDMALAQLAGFDGQSLEDIRSFVAARERFLEDCVRRHGAATGSPCLATLPVGLTHEDLPSAAAVYYDFDDSYAIGIEEDFIDLLIVLLNAAYCSTLKGQLDLYRLVLIEAFSFFYVGGGVSLISLLERLVQMVLQLRPENRRALSDLRMATVAFVLNHEAAHVELGHLLEKAPAKIPQSGNEATGRISAYPGEAAPGQARRFETEFEADRRAFDVHLHLISQGQNPRDTVALAPILATTLLGHITREGAGLSIVGEVMRKSHPPETERSARLDSQARERIHIEGTPDTLKVVEFVEKLDGPIIKP